MRDELEEMQTRIGRICGWESGHGGEEPEYSRHEMLRDLQTVARRIRGLEIEVREPKVPEVTTPEDPWKESVNRKLSEYGGE